MSSLPLQVLTTLPASPIGRSAVADAAPGIALYTYHKYQKSIASPLPLDSHGRPISPSSLAPQGQDHQYTSVDGGAEPPMPLSRLQTPSPSTYPPPARETAEDRTQRLRDEFEGWGREDETWSDGDADDEVEDDEVERRMTERDGSKGVTTGRTRWGEWWGKEM